MARIDKWAAKPVEWKATGDAFYPYGAVIEGQRWQLRVNDFPDHPHLWTLCVDGEPVAHVKDWPSAWTGVS